MPEDRASYTKGVDPKQAFKLDAHPMTMFHLLDEEDVEDSWLTWDHDTIWHEIEQKYDVYPSEAAKSTISALKACIINRAPWNDVHIFSNVAQALAAGVADLERLQRPSPGQLLFSIYIMNGIDEKEEFSEDVVKFQAACCLDHGIIWAEDELEDANKYLAEQCEEKDCEDAKNTYEDLSSNRDVTVDDDNLAQVSGAKLYVARKWADELKNKRVFDE